MNNKTVRQKDYYRVLGVPPDASTEDIKKAFKKLAFQYHPDRTRGNHGAEENFKMISEAYRVLTNEQKRRDYDLTRRIHHGASSPRSGQNGTFRNGRQTSVNDVERDLLGDLFFELSKKGVDIQSSALGQTLFGKKGIFFGEAFFVDPHANDDEGEHDVPTPSGPHTVPGLFGRGFLASMGKKLNEFFFKKGNTRPGKDESRDLYFTMPITIHEAIRGGKKRVSLKRGKNTETLLVKIPPGTKPGMKLRIKGKGRQGRPGVNAGDLYFKINIQ